jgi:hypothetical protein
MAIAQPQKSSEKALNILIGPSGFLVGMDKKE